MIWILSLNILLQYTGHTTFTIHSITVVLSKQEIIFRNREVIHATHLSSVSINDIAKICVSNVFIMVASVPPDVALLYLSPKEKNLIVAQTMITRNHLVPLSS